jgi:hypothetical protein
MYSECLWVGRPRNCGSIPDRARDLFSAAYRPSLGPIQPSFLRIPAAFAQGAKRPWREADHSLPFSAELRKCESTLPVRPYPQGLYLHSTHRNNPFKTETNSRTAVRQPAAKRIAASYGRNGVDVILTLCTCGQPVWPGNTRRRQPAPEPRRDAEPSRTTPRRRMLRASLCTLKQYRHDRHHRHHLHISTGRKQTRKGQPRALTRDHRNDVMPASSHVTFSVNHPNGIR